MPEGVGCGRQGHVITCYVGGERIRISIDGRRVVDEQLLEAERLWSGSIASYFELRRAIA